MFIELRRRRLRHAGSRGFTLIELVTVVLVIGIIAVIATPTMAGQFRERRARQTAQEIALLFSNARMRAMGRGAAVMVQYNAASGFTVRESIEGSFATDRGAADCAALPGRGCLSTQWATPADSREITSYNPLAGGEIQVTMKAPGSTTPLTQASICFSPLGRSFASYTTALPTSAMAGAATIEVNRGSESISRTIAVLPNGSARLAL